MNNTLKGAQRILIVGVNWLGDMIFMTPAIRAIRRHYPHAFMACLVPPRGVDLFEGNPHLDQVIPLQESRGLRGIFLWWPLIRRIKAEGFDTVFLFHRSFSRTLMVWASGIRQRVGFRTFKRGWLLTQAIDPPPKDSLHKSRYFLRLLEGAGVPSDGLHYEVKILPEDEQKAKVLLAQWGIESSDRLVGIHVGANWRLKRWPCENFAQLADLLALQCQVKVLLLGDQGDLPLVENVLKRMKTQPLVATGIFSFRQLGAILKRANLLVSNDSGPLHLGLAVGTPVLALFGPTDPKLTGPLENAGRAVTLFGSIGCPVPCVQLHCPVNLCMSQIHVEDAFVAAKQLLG